VHTFNSECTISAGNTLRIGPAATGRCSCRVKRFGRQLCKAFNRRILYGRYAANI